MGQYEFTGIIRTDLNEAWELLDDPTKLHWWGSLSRPVSGLDRPLRPGDRFTEIRRDLGIDHAVDVEVEVVEPPHRLVLRTHERRRTARATLSLQVESARNGTVRFDELVEYSLGKGGFVRALDQRVVNPFVGFVERRRMGRAFGRLKAILESRPD